MTPLEWACALSTTSASTPARTSSAARSRASPPAPTAAATRSRPSASLQACGWRMRFSMSFTVMRPWRRPLPSTTGSFSMRCFCRIARASSSVVPDRRRDQVLARHHLGDALRGRVLEAQVAVGEDADQAPLLGDGHARDVEARHERARLAQGRGGRQRHRVGDHAALRALHAVHLRALLGDGEVLVDHSEAALAGQRDGQLGLGDRVHGRADDAGR